MLKLNVNVRLFPNKCANKPVELRSFADSDRLPFRGIDQAVHGVAVSIGPDASDKLDWHLI